MSEQPIPPEEIGLDTTVESILAYILSLPTHAHAAATEDCIDKLRRLAQAERRAHYAARAAELARLSPRPRIRRSESGYINVDFLDSTPIELRSGPVRVDRYGFVPDEKEQGSGEPDRSVIEFAKRVLRCFGGSWASDDISSRELASLVTSKIAEVPRWRHEALYEHDRCLLGSPIHGAVIVAAYELGWSVRRDGRSAVLSKPLPSRRTTA